MNKGVYFVFLFLFLALLQVLILNNIRFLGFINPYLYISFIFFFPLKNNRFPILFFAFLLGLTIDLFSDSGGIHALATVFIAYIRLFFVSIIFKKTELDYLLFNIWLEPFGKVFNYVVSLTVIHHFILFSLENFSMHNITNVILNTVFSSIFTLFLFFLGSMIFNKSNK